MAESFEQATIQDRQLSAGAGYALESDEALAVRAAHDAAAFAELYHRYAEPIRRYCGFRLRDWWAVDDATSEIFVKALESLHKTTVTCVRPWLFAIAHHHMTDLHRRRRIEVDLDATRDLASTEPGPEEVSVLQSDVERLREAILLLTPDQAQVIQLRLSGLDGPEIRQVLNRSRSWVDTTQYRALIRLRAALHAGQSPEVN
jgi:RNA polymerase sigma factor (sigma-70 family)